MPIADWISGAGCTAPLAHGGRGERPDSTAAPRIAAQHIQGAGCGHAAAKAGHVKALHPAAVDVRNAGGLGGRRAENRIDGCIELAVLACRGEGEGGWGVGVGELCCWEGECWEVMRGERQQRTDRAVASVLHEAGLRENICLGACRVGGAGGGGREQSARWCGERWWC